MHPRSMLRAALDAISVYRGHRVRAQTRAGRRPHSASPRLEQLENRWLLSTFFVNTTDDNNDHFCDQSHCSLREAIEVANKASGPDVIRFNISTQGIPSIRPNTELPTITDPVTIDGTTQSAGRVELNGNTVSSGGNWMAARGFVITGGDSTVRGMVINGFLGVGIYMTEGGGNVIEGNWIGTDSTGEAAGGTYAVWGGQEYHGNDGGIVIQRSHGNKIGGETQAARNVISGNSYGISLSEADANLIVGNFIGTNPAGTAVVPNHVGVSINESAANLIGGTTVGARNVISGNKSHGVSVAGNQNRVQGNFIGTDITGTRALGNGWNGISVGGNGNVIGGSVHGAGNVIAASTYAGIGVSGGTLGTVIQGNLVGTDVTGRVALGNGDGLDLIDASNVTIGGRSPGAANVISGNNNVGIRIRYSSGTSNQVLGNFIGTDATATVDVGNAGPGLLIDSASDNTIGGATPGEGNVIAFNRGGGVSVVTHTDSATGNSILANSIFSNAGLGIDLNGDRISPNDSDAMNDGDDGANLLQNFPILTEVLAESGSTRFRGGLSSAPATVYRIELFSSPLCDPAGFAEGGTYLGSIDVTTDAAGNASFDVALTGAAAPDTAFTATATDSAGNTSEFSPVSVDTCLVDAPPIVVNTTGDQSDADPADGACDSDLAVPGVQCSLRAAIEIANRSPDRDPIHFNIPGDGIPTIRPDELPKIVRPVIIDGTTQPAGRVELNGDEASRLIGNLEPNVIGLQIRGGNSIVRGMVINGFRWAGIAIEGGGDNTIEGNWIGPDTTGNARGGTYYDPQGREYHGNFRGVAIRDSLGNTIGGYSLQARNVLSGNWVGISMMWGQANLIVGNLIGTNATGDAALPNYDGLRTWESAGNTIGGVTEAARNVISGNTSVGISLGGHRNVVQGNFIGTDITGMRALANGGGISLSSGQGNVIGGAITGAGNLISGNQSAGIGVCFDRNTADPKTLIQGNLIGTDVTGTAPLGNGVGIDVCQAPHTTIGGTNPGAGNVISGNNDFGLRIRDDFYWKVNSIVVFGNVIGTDRAGALAIGNLGDGILIRDSSQNTIGGSGVGEANIIAFNGGNGVSVSEEYKSATRNFIGANSIFSNARLGINLGDEGPYVNDPQDTDNGANNLQNTPVLQAAIGGSSTAIRGSIHSTPDAQFRLQFFANPAVGSISEGRRYVGSYDLITNRFGDANFTARLAAEITSAGYVTATATDASGNTSEFSAPVQVVFDEVLENHPPTAVHGGAYEVAEGKTTVFDGGASVDPDQPTTTLNFAWDLDNDGVFGESGAEALRGDELGSRPVFSAVGLPLSTTHPVALRVTDDEGATDERTTELRVVPNHAPIADAGGPYDVIKGRQTSLNGSASSDPDQLGSTLIYEWDLDGDGVVGEIGAEASRGDEIGIRPVFSAAGLAGNFTVTVSLRVTDDYGLTHTDTAEIKVLPGNPPTAAPGGPYRVVERHYVVLYGFLSSDPDQSSDTLKYEWDLDGDGVFGETNSPAVHGHEVSPNPLFQSRKLVAPTTVQITLRVTDNDGFTDEASVDVVIEKNSPPMAVIGGPYSVLGGESITLDASGSTDPNQRSDRLIYQWDLDGDGLFGEIGSAAARGTEVGMRPRFSAAGLTGPTFAPVALRVTDDEGLTNETTTSIRIQFMLNVPGTARPDVITIGPSGSGNELVVSVNGSMSRYDLADLAGFTVDAGPGNDRVEVAANVVLSGSIAGGLGNDTITGGGGDDVIRGGVGHDRLTGGPGNDTVEGEAGNDVFTASRGVDRMVLGSGRNSIVLGALAASLQSLNGVATATPSQKGGTASGSSTIRVVLDSALSGYIYFSADTISVAKGCTNTLTMRGESTVSGLAYTAFVSGSGLIRCENGDGNYSPIRANLSGRISLQDATITTSGTIESWFGRGVSRKRVRGADSLTEVATSIS